MCHIYPDSPFHLSNIDWSVSRSYWWLLLVPIGIWEAVAWRFGLPSITYFARQHAILRAVVAGFFVGWWILHSDATVCLGP
jgi:hypothetical protein